MGGAAGAAGDVAAGPATIRTGVEAHRAGTRSVELLAGLGVTSLGWWQALQRPPQVVVETVRETVPEPASVAVVSNDSGDALWIARIYPASGQADVRVANAPQARPGNDYQLWALPEGGVPVSLGLLPQSGARDLVLSPAAQSALMRTATVAVSLEPPGGSPEPVPTGPVLFTAALLAP